MSKNKDLTMKDTKKNSTHQLIASNSHVRANYFIQEVIEAGLVLTGTEVKSLRTQGPHLRDAFVDIQPKKSGFEAWLMNAHIAPYTHGNIWNHEPLRKRKLLLHQDQMAKLYGAIVQQGSALVPLKMYFTKGQVKIELGLGRGKKKHDKREDLKKRSADREIAQAMKQKRAPLSS